MQQFKKHIAGFLLGIFALGVIPAPLLHEIFADHKDTADNHCQYFHKDLGTHIEEQQNHCSVFNAQTPLYDAVKVIPDLQFSFYFISECKPGTISSHAFAQSLRIPARAPPVV